MMIRSPISCQAGLACRRPEFPSARRRVASGRAAGGRPAGGARAPAGPPRAAPRAEIGPCGLAASQERSESTAAGFFRSARASRLTPLRRGWTRRRARRRDAAWGRVVGAADGRVRHGMADPVAPGDRRRALARLPARPPATQQKRWAERGHAFLQLRLVLACSAHEPAPRAYRPREPTATARILAEDSS